MKRLRSELSLAEGFYEIGLYVDAWEELDKLPTNVQADPDILSFRLNVLLALDRWDDAAALGAGCCRGWPQREEFFLRTAHALMQMMEYDKAIGLLKAAPKTLHLQAEYHYMLARCAALSGKVDEAKRALQNCFECDKNYRQRALDDVDLESVW